MTWKDVKPGVESRIGVYGGTFDPLHEGHLRIALAILEAFELDRLLLVPAAIPPHKRGVSITSAYHRMAMLALATADLPDVSILPIELESPGRPYTIETLGQIQQGAPSSRLFFVMGSDSFQDVTKWRDYGRILTEYDVIVATRPGYPTGRDQTREEMIAHLPVEIQVRVVDLRDGMRPASAITRSRHIYLTDYVSVDVSATDVRRAAAEGRSLVGIVPTRVADYIHKYGLYRNQL